MKVICCMFLLTITTFHNVDSAKILGFFPTDTQSHYMVYGLLMGELARRGHDVTLVSLFPGMFPEYKMENLRDIGLNGTMKLPEMTFEELLAMGDIGNQFDIMNICTQTCQEVLNHPIIPEILKQKFDLLITEIFGTDCFISLGYKLNVPTVGVVSSVMLPWVSDMIGTPDNPSYIPVYFEPYSENMTFLQRVYNTFTNVIMKILYNMYSIKPSQRIIDKVFGSMPSIEDLRKNLSLILVNTHNSINPIKPLVPQVVEIGGLHITKTLKKLPTELETYLNASKNGVVYFSLGSIARVETMKKEKLSEIIQVLGSLKENVLWKIDDTKLGTLPSNIKTIKWTPQLEVLCHPNIRLFISHGGLLGTHESVYCGVPILGIPTFADQGHNLAQIQMRGMGRLLQFKDLTGKTFSETLDDLLRNKKYVENAKKVSAFFKDRPMHPVDLAMYWIEFIIKHKDISHLKPNVLNMEWYQYYLLDVIGFFSVIIIALFIALKYVYTIVFNKNKKIKKNKED